MKKLDRRLRMGMVGGGPGAFIGEVHRKAARMDGGIELVAGAFDINPRMKGASRICQRLGIPYSPPVPKEAVGASEAK